jgi:hypothetical protein
VTYGPRSAEFVLWLVQLVKPSSRIVGLVFFIGLVATVQIVEHLFRWYVHRDERVELAALREELIDVGAEMIETQLAIEQIRAAIVELDANGYGPRIAVYPAGRYHGRTSESASAAPRDVAVVDEHRRARVLERNRHLDELNGVVARRNSAAARYYLLADSIRSVAERVRDPYFAIPLPAEAATARGITASGPPPAATRSRPGATSTAHGPASKPRRSHN